MEQVPLVLVVDDNPDFREIFLSKLIASGFRAEAAKDGAEGLMKIKSLHPDLVLLDMLMPIHSGADVLAEIKKDPTIKDTRVVFLSNAGTADPLSLDADKKVSHDVGANDYIYKTDNLEVVVDKVRAFLSPK